MNTTIQYGGRAAGAFLAYKFLAPRIGSGPWAIAGAIAIGWLGGGLITDQVLRRQAEAAK